MQAHSRVPVGVPKNTRRKSVNESPDHEGDAAHTYGNGSSALDLLAKEPHVCRAKARGVSPAALGRASRSAGAEVTSASMEPLKTEPASSG